jgi:hypothetical protein
MEIPALKVAHFAKRRQATTFLTRRLRVALGIGGAWIEA